MVCRCSQISISLQIFCISTQYFSGAVPITGAFLNHQWSVVIFDINCTGSELTLEDCPYNGVTDHLCLPREAASLICQSEYSELVRFIVMSKNNQIRSITNWHSSCLFLHGYYSSVVIYYLRTVSSYFFGNLK